MLLFQGSEPAGPFQTLHASSPWDLYNHGHRMQAHKTLLPSAWFSKKHSTGPMLLVSYVLVELVPKIYRHQQKTKYLSHVSISHIVNCTQPNLRGPWQSRQLGKQTALGLRPVSIQHCRVRGWPCHPTARRSTQPSCLHALQQCVSLLGINGQFLRATLSGIPHSSLFIWAAETNFFNQQDDGPHGYSAFHTVQLFHCTAHILSKRIWFTFKKSQLT